MRVRAASGTFADWVPLPPPAAVPLCVAVLLAPIRGATRTPIGTVLAAE